VKTNLCTSEAEVDRLNDAAIDQGYEGGIIRLNDDYQQKRSNSLLKRKHFDDEEFIIVRIEEGQGNWAGCAKRVIFQNNQGECGESGAGMRGKKTDLRKVYLNRALYIGKEATIRYFGRTPGKLKPRIPVVTSLHLTPRM
jgi:DNA ligase-1